MTFLEFADKNSEMVGWIVVIAIIAGCMTISSVVEQLRRRK